MLCWLIDQLQMWLKYLAYLYHRQNGFGLCFAPSTGPGSNTVVSTGHWGTQCKAMGLLDFFWKNGLDYDLNITVWLWLVEISQLMTQTAINQLPQCFGFMTRVWRQVHPVLEQSLGLIILCSRTTLVYRKFPLLYIQKDSLSVKVLAMDLKS